MNYLILTEGRTGSTLLCQYLRQMQVGKPSPYLSSEIREPDASDLESIKARLEEKRVNGILGMKTSWGILSKLDRELGLEMNLYEFFETICPDAKFLYMVRRDRVHQALSREKHLRMDLSHVWNAEDYDAYIKRESEILEDASVPLDLIRERIFKNAVGYRAWEIFFDAYQITPLEVVFEDLVTDRERVLTEICEFLEVPVRLDLTYGKLRSTHTHINDRWYESVMEGYLKLL